MGTKNIDKLKSGKYRARYSIPNGRRISKTFERQQEAKNWLYEQVDRYEKHGLPCGSSKMFFGAFYEGIFEPEYLSDRGLKETTLADYKYYYNRIFSRIADVSLAQIDEEFIERLIKIYSPSVQNHILSILKVILDAAVKEKLIGYNPARNSMLKKKTHRTKKKKIALSEEEIHSISDELIKNETGNIVDFTLLLAISTGMRFGELAALEWGDIDYRNKFIKVDKNLQYNVISREPLIQPPKTEAGERKIPIGDDVFTILSKIPKQEAKDPQFKDLIFVRKNGLPLTDKACNERLEDVCKKTGVRRVTIHDLRHTFATRCVESEINISSAQKILGHSKVSMTLDIYTHVSDKKNSEEFLKMNSIFSDEGSI